MPGVIFFKVKFKTRPHPATVSNLCRRVKPKAKRAGLHATAGRRTPLGAIQR